MARPTRHNTTKVQKTISVTPDSWENLEDIARQFLISRSELIQLIGSGTLRVVRDETKTA
ncbi:hypothetical protein HW132_33830 [Brasilonema sp. CT11]|nr:hypothetical protein [Brasilonema sp. CT11]